MKPSRILLLTTIATGTLYLLSFFCLHHGHPTVETSGQEIVAWFLGFLFVAGLLVWTMPRLDRAADAT